MFVCTYHITRPYISMNYNQKKLNTHCTVYD